MRNSILTATLICGTIIHPNLRIITDDDLEGISLYSVFTLSNKTTAIVSPMSDDNTIFSQFDEIFMQLDGEEKFREGFFEQKYDKKSLFNVSPYDTTGVYKLSYNQRLEKEMKPLVSTVFYVYGTKGMEMKLVKKIAFGLDECKTNIYAFVIDPFNYQINGDPVIASDKKLDIVYGNNYHEIESKINEFYKSIYSDYTDDVPTKVYANLGSLYFTYSDDFKWSENLKIEDIGCFFPARGIFRLENDNTVTPVWEDELDLYGIPCD